MASLVWKPSFSAIGTANCVKPPETSAVKAPCARIHLTRVLAPGSQADPFGKNLVNGLDAQPGEQRDALAQSRHEFDLAAHGARRDPCDMLLHAKEIGDFVETFLGDHGRIHVGDEKLFAPAGGALNNDIDRHDAACLAQNLGEARCFGVAPRREGNVRGDPLCEPKRHLRSGQESRDTFNKRCTECRAARIGDDCRNMGHERSHSVENVT